SVLRALAYILCRVFQICLQLVALRHALSLLPVARLLIVPFGTPPPREMRLICRRTLRGCTVSTPVRRKRFPPYTPWLRGRCGRDASLHKANLQRAMRNKKGSARRQTHHSHHTIPTGFA